MDTMEKLKRVHGLFQIARQDPEYSALGEEYDKLEERYAIMVQKLEEEDENLAWEFVLVSDSMNWRMMELICERYDIRPDLEENLILPLS